MAGGTSSSLQAFVLGLDGACLPVLHRLRERGAVPTIGSLLEAGYRNGLESQLPPWTPSAWPSLYTGVNPGKHGVYGFLTFDGYDWTVVDRTDVREFAVWELLDRHGVSSVVVNVPVTHPARAIDGAVVPGYVAPENPDCTPDDALDVAGYGSAYTIYPPKGDDVPRSAHLDAMADLAVSRGEVFRRLVDHVGPAFGFLQFQVTDTVFHEHPGDWDAIERVYGAVDEQVDRVLESCDPRNVFVVSDHGIGKYAGYEFRVNEFLREEGYVATRRGGEGMPSWDSIARNQLREGEDAGERDPGVLERAAALAARAGVTSQRIQRVLEPLGLAEVVAEVAPTDAVRAGTEQVDFRNSTAYMRSRIELGVRLNLVGREPDGTVPEDEYGKVRAEIVDALGRATTPDGSPVFDAVRSREDVFEGPYLEEAPDIVVVPAGFDHFVSGSFRGGQFGAPQEPWNHKRVGVFAATGPDVSPASAETGRPHLFDVAPTVLSALGVPPSDRMDGDPLPLVEPCARQRYPEFNARELRSRTDEEVERHLRDLGYVEDV